MTIETDHSITPFDELLSSFPRIGAAVKSSGITEPTPVQQQVVPVALEGRDVIAQAKTGSGKTLSFAIPLLAHLQLVEDKEETVALAITPTRELASQVHQVICKLNPDISPVCVIGGMSIGAQVAALKKDRRVVVGTPGRILDLVRQKELSLRSVRFFALDEADEMLSLGFFEEVFDILSLLPKHRHGMFLSATISGRVGMLSSKFLTRPEVIVVENTHEENQQIEHLYCQLKGDLLAKPNAACSFLGQLDPKSAIIFCNTKSETEFLEAILKRRGFNAERINSDLTQKQRNRIIAAVRDDSLRYLIATDVAARGLDIDHIELVVNYSLHHEPETYVHRVGRTGRAGRSGKALTFVSPLEFGAFHALKKTLQIDLKEVKVPEEERAGSAA